MANAAAIPYPEPHSVPELEIPSTPHQLSEFLHEQADTLPPLLSIQSDSLRFVANSLLSAHRDHINGRASLEPEDTESLIQTRELLLRIRNDSVHRVAKAIKGVIHVAGPQPEAATSHKSVLWIWDQQKPRL